MKDKINYVPLNTDYSEAITDVIYNHLECVGIQVLLEKFDNDVEKVLKYISEISGVTPDVCECTHVMCAVEEVNMDLKSGLDYINNSIDGKSSPVSICVIDRINLDLIS